MATKWTMEQKAAIEIKNCNMLVAAAAGSGKTAVLVERIIKKITDVNEPVDIDKLLIVTFTNAAAAEMRERIGQALSNIESDNQHMIAKQLMLLPKASITTIHSFCLEVIRNNFFMLDIDPCFKIMDQTESIIMKSQVAEELFEELYMSEKNEYFLELIERFSGQNPDDSLRELIIKIYEFSRSSPFPKKWIENSVEIFDVDESTDFLETVWGRIIFERVLIESETALRYLYNARSLCLETEGFEKYIETLDSDIRYIDDFLKSNKSNWDECISKAYEIDFIRLGNVKKGVDEEVKEQAKKYRDYAKKTINEIKGNLLAKKSDEIMRELRLVYPNLKQLTAIIDMFDNQYTNKKKEKAVVDFNDLEHLCLSILIKEEDGIVAQTETAKALMNKYEEILIDEYQDSNSVQEYILNAISKKHIEKPNVFMVGDVKQSIYRFRQAKPELFLDKYGSYNTVEGYDDLLIVLSKNFRSRSEILLATNFVFANIMSKRVGSLDYTEKEALYLGMNYPPFGEHKSLAGVELDIIEFNNSGKKYESENQDDIKEEVDDVDDIIDKVKAEAIFTANRIQELINDDYKVYDKNLNDYRTVEYRDMVILMRATSSYAEIFAEELANMGVPFFSDTGSGYYNSSEIRTIISLLTIIDNPMQDIPLLSVLRSPLFSFSEEELLKIRVRSKEGLFFHSLIDYTKEGLETNIVMKIENFLALLENWRKQSVVLSLDELIWQLYEDTGFYLYIGATVGGVQKQANLRLLFMRAKQFEKTSYKGLFNFLKHIEKMKNRHGDLDVAKTIGEKENVVRLMSIHKSKGLEFPVVFLCGTSRKFNLRDAAEKVLLDHELGFGPDYIDAELGIIFSTAAKKAVKEKLLFESISEEMRILYVGFTRARERLIITGITNEIEKKVKELMPFDAEQKTVSVETVAKSRSYLDWIIAAILRHKSGNALYDYCNISKKIVPDADDLEWNINIIKMADIISKVKKMEGVSEDFVAYKEKELSSIYEEINTKLSWTYEYLNLSKIPSKVSVTELGKYTDIYDKERSVLDVPEIKKPSFLEDKQGLSAATKGTVVHYVLQHIDFAKTYNMAVIEEQVEQMFKKGLISKTQRSAVDTNSIYNFVGSDIGLRLRDSFLVHRETPFAIYLDSKEMKVFEGQEILVQGIIDCWFEEQDGIIIIDYKTDKITLEQTSSRALKYENQLMIYQLALEKMTGKKVKEKYIYFLNPGVTYKVN